MLGTLRMKAGFTLRMVHILCPTGVLEIAMRS